MNVELGRLPNGNMVILSDGAFPAEVIRVEYYRDQHLIMLVYNDDLYEDDLMHYELNDVASENVERSSCAVVITAPPGMEMTGYDVPILQIGDVY